MSVVTLAQVKTHLNISVATYDTELQTVLDSCEAAIVKKVGPLTSVATTSRAEGYSGCLTLPVPPVISLTSVTPNAGSALTVSDLTVTTGGQVEFTVGGWFPAPWYTVVYNAGRTTLPDDLRLAVLELVRHKWAQSQRGGSARPGSPVDPPATAYSFPFSVLELLGPHVQVGL